MDKPVLLLLFIEKQLEPDAIDCLIGLPEVSGFTLSQVQGFSREHAQFDQAEQVAGSRSLLKLEILHQPEHTAVILDALKALNGRHPPRYWLVPVLAEGHVADA